MAVASASTAKTLPPQSPESPPPMRSSDAASQSTATTDAAASLPSPAKDVQIQTQASQRSEEYRQLFRLPPEEVLIRDFNCALQENFLLQGHMYVFGHHICFYSNLFGFETKKVIPFREVASVQRAKAAGIFPTAIEIMAGGKKYYFTSFLSRDEAFKLISEGWLQHGVGAKAIEDLQDPNVNFRSQENEDNMTEKEESSGKQPVDESDSGKRNKDIPILEDPSFPPEAEEEIASPPGKQNTGEENAETVVNSGSSSSEKNLAWQEETSDAPKVPEGYTKVAESKFLIKVEKFFDMFFSDNAVDFVETYHRSCGDKDFKCSTWYSHDTFGHVRDVTFQHPIKIYFGAKFGTCQEFQKYRVYRNSHLVIETTQDVHDVPYGDYFQVQGLWHIERDDDGSKESCIMRIYVNVEFFRKTMFKGKIIQTTIDEAQDTYATWTENAHELLKQKHLEKKDGRNLLTDAATNGQIQHVKMEKTGESAEGLEQASDLKVSEILPASEDVDRLVGDPIRRTYNVTSHITWLRESLIKFYLSLKSQRQIPLLVVITLTVILLLMQLSIVALLTRPQQVQLISPPDYMSSACSLSERMPETTTLLEKRMRLLKDEMLTTEALLQKMQSEHAFLKAQLKELEEHSRRHRTL
ncbi:hypothetical protein NMG60_11029217 [Bertholletia excelsa]